MSTERQYNIRYFQKNVQTIDGDRIWMDYSNTPLSEEEAFSVVAYLEDKQCVVEMTLLS